jgi:hypothetical protein
MESPPSPHAVRAASLVPRLAIPSPFRHQLSPQAVILSGTGNGQESTQSVRTHRDPSVRSGPASGPSKEPLQPQHQTNSMFRPPPRQTTDNVTVGLPLVSRWRGRPGRLGTPSCPAPCAKHMSTRHQGGLDEKRFQGEPRRNDCKKGPAWHETFPTRS